MRKSYLIDELGLNKKITRRDFIYISAAAVVAGSGIPKYLRASGQSISDIDGWYGYGGIGDYASSHGNTPETLKVAHGMRNGEFNSSSFQSKTIDTGEIYDLVVVGGGFSGLSAAFHYNKQRPSDKCLIIDNHPIFGGEAKRNEFIVNGHRIIGPQGSNGFVIPPVTNKADDYFTELSIPREFKYAPVPKSVDGIKFPLDNYGFMHWLSHRSSVGHFFNGSGANASGNWVTDLWENDLSSTPWSENLRKEFLRWRKESVTDYKQDNFEKWLDSMTLKEYYENILKLPKEVTNYADPILASAIGLGCDAISAYWGWYFSLPGFGNSDRYQSEDLMFHSFPGGNTGIARFFVKKLVPNAIKGANNFNDTINQSIAFNELDKSSNKVRMRLGATVIDVRHAGIRSEKEKVIITYVKGEKIYQLKARKIVMATAGNMNRYVLHDLPEGHKKAYASFHHSAVLVANVALTNWRFLKNLGFASCMWTSGFGFSCNIRRPMVVGKYQQPFDPNLPIVLTFYVPMYYPGLSIKEQGTTGRLELLTTPFVKYEQQIREQMFRLFGHAGFNPQTDIAGIILNRWGHAYVNPQPGFMYDKKGGETASAVIRKPFGRIAIGHSELRGHMNWTGAAAEGKRAINQLMENKF